MRLEHQIELRASVKSLPPQFGHCLTLFLHELIVTQVGFAGAAIITDPRILQHARGLENRRMREIAPVHADYVIALCTMTRHQSSSDTL